MSSSFHEILVFNALPKLNLKLKKFQISKFSKGILNAHLPNT